MAKKLKFRLFRLGAKRELFVLPPVVLTTHGGNSVEVHNHTDVDVTVDNTHLDATSPIKIEKKNGGTVHSGTAPLRAEADQPGKQLQIKITSTTGDRFVSLIGSDPEIIIL